MATPFGTPKASPCHLKLLSWEFSERDDNVMMIAQENWHHLSSPQTVRRHPHFLRQGVCWTTAQSEADVVLLPASLGEEQGCC